MSNLLPEMTRVPHCSCTLPEGHWSQGGWHLYAREDDTEACYERCPAYGAAKERGQLVDMLSEAGVPSHYQGYTRERWRGEWPKKVQEFVEHGPLAGMLYIHGANGTGKTHLATAALGLMMQDGAGGMWVSAKLLPEEIFENRRKHNSCRVCRVLVVDDLFAERSTDYAAEPVRNLIERRYQNQRTTIVTSMLSPIEAKERDSDLASRACSGERVYLHGRDRRWGGRA